MFQKLCGESALRNVVIVTNMWGGVTTRVGEKREADLKGKDIFFKSILDKHAQMARHLNTVDSARSILRLMLNNPPLPLLIQEEIADNGKDITETSAGQELDRELLEERRKHEEEKRILEEEIQQARKDMEDRLKKEQEEEARRQEEKRRYEEEKRILEEERQQAMRDRDERRKKKLEEQAKLWEERRKHEEEMRKLEEQRQQEMRDREERLKKELEEEARKMQDEINRIKADSARMASDYQDKQRTMDAHLVEINRRAQGSLTHGAIPTDVFPILAVAGAASAVVVAGVAAGVATVAAPVVMAVGAVAVAAAVIVSKIFSWF